jgi:hypothetical protein
MAKNLVKNKRAEDPSIHSEAYATMLPRWDMINAVLGGTEAMREAGEVYMPRHQEETATGYMDRLQSATLLNITEHTLETLVGKPFSSPITVHDDMPENVKELLSDVDLQGNRIDVVARQWFRWGLAKAFCHMLVDFPVKPEDMKTLKDEERTKMRPYWVLIQPECLLAARSEMVNGVETLVHARILETYKAIDGFDEVVKQRIRVFEPGTVAVHEPKEVKGKTVWQQTGLWSTGLSVIPLVTWYSAKDGLTLGKPPLLDLAYRNITHWQSSSDQRHILTVARFPILACSGAGADADDITIGPNKVLYTRDANGKYYYVEHQGKAIEAGRTDLQDLESQMASYGAQFLKKRPGTETATAAAIDSAEATSQLQAWVQTFGDALAQALYLTARWLSKDAQTGGTVEFGEWSETEESVSNPLAILQEARKNKDLSREAFVAALKEHDILPEDFDAEDDLTSLSDEAWRNITPQELQQLLALAQANKLTFTETRAILRKAGLATLEDEEARGELEEQMDFGGSNNGGPNPPGTNPPEPPAVPPKQPALSPGTPTVPPPQR